MEENAKIVLTFITNTGAKDEYEIPRANVDMTAQEIGSGMSEIIDNGNFATTDGRPMQIESAELIETTVSEML